MIKTFLFDMGNVLVRFCHTRMCAQIGELCGRPGDDVREALFGSELQWRFERGFISEGEFHIQMEQLLEHALDQEALIHAGSNIFELNESLVPILDALRAGGHRLVLLSNTSVSHFEFVQRTFDVLDRFDDFVLSYRVGAMKPEPAIYTAALHAIQCEPRECFYTDDIPDYVAQGRKFGLDAEVFTDTETFQQQLAARGITVP